MVGGSGVGGGVQIQHMPSKESYHAQNMALLQCSAFYFGTIQFCTEQYKTVQCSAM